LNNETNLIILLLTFGAFDAIAAEGPASPSPQPSPQDQVGRETLLRKRQEILGKYEEISKKVNEEPDIKELKAKADQAQEAYRKAFEAAVAKVDPEILAKFP